MVRLRLERINLHRLIEEAVELISKYEKENIRPETEKPMESQEGIGFNPTMVRLRLQFMMP